MRIAEGVNVRLAIMDIETLACLFDAGFYDPDTGKWMEFQISPFRNDMYRLITYYTGKNYDYTVTFNGIGFDHQVLEYIVKNAPEWYDFTNEGIIEKIYRFAQKVIDDGKYKIRPPFKEQNFHCKTIDLFKIHHLDNQAKWTSLKWCAFMMNMDVEEMPYHHSTKNLTQAQIDEVIMYRRQDCMVTKGLLDITLGNTDIPELADYKGKNKIQDRFDVYKETGLQCLNMSDVSIGEEWNKLDYVRAKKITEKDEYDTLYPKKVKQPYGQKFKNFFPKTMQFTTDHLNNFIKNLGEQVVKAKKKKEKKEQEFPVVIGNTKYNIAQGGIHSCEKNRLIIPPKGYTLRDADVGGQYPNSILKFRVVPPHLDEELVMDQFFGKVEKRTIYKAKGKALEKEGKKDESRPYMSVQEMLKLCQNGGYYGKLGQQGSFLEFPEGKLKICMGNQIEILMLVEMMEGAGFQVLSANTDGIVVLFPTDKEDVYKQICKDWEIKVGNTRKVGDAVMGALEYTDFESFYQQDINSYLAKKVDGTIKKKGRFVTVYGSGGCEINKNKSKRIIALALEAYFIDKKDPVTFIREHKNIFDFCIAKKTSGAMHYEEEWFEDGIKNTKVHKKLVRYFISNKGTVLYKRGFNFKGKAVNSHCEAKDKDYPSLPQPLVTYFNKFLPVKDFSEYDINYDYYIVKTLQSIDAIEKKAHKAKQYVESLKPKAQMSLF